MTEQHPAQKTSHSTVKKSSTLTYFHYNLNSRQKCLLFELYQAGFEICSLDASTVRVRLVGQIASQKFLDFCQEHSISMHPEYLENLDLSVNNQGEFFVQVNLGH